MSALDTIDHLNRYLNTTTGREKLCRLVQYFARFYAFYLFRVGGSKVEVERWTNLKSHIANGRKFFRLLKPIEFGRVAHKSLTVSDEILRATAVLKQIGMALYYSSEVFVLVSATSPSDRWASNTGIAYRPTSFVFAVDERNRFLQAFQDPADHRLWTEVLVLGYLCLAPFRAIQVQAAQRAPPSLGEGTEERGCVRRERRGHESRRAGQGARKVRGGKPPYDADPFNATRTFYYYIIGITTRRATLSCRILSTLPSLLLTSSGSVLTRA